MGLTDSLWRCLGHVAHLLDTHLYELGWWPAGNVAVVSCVACDATALDITYTSPVTGDPICERHPVAVDADGTVVATHAETAGRLGAIPGLFHPDFEMRADTNAGADDDRRIREVGLHEVSADRMGAIVDGELWDGFDDSNADTGGDHS